MVFIFNKNVSLNNKIKNNMFNLTNTFRTPELFHLFAL